MKKRSQIPKPSKPVTCVICIALTREASAEANLIAGLAMGASGFVQDTASTFCRRHARSMASIMAAVAKERPGTSGGSQ